MVKPIDGLRRRRRRVGPCALSDSLPPHPPFPALHMACANGHVDVVKRLVEAGAVSCVHHPMLLVACIAAPPPPPCNPPHPTLLDPACPSTLTSHHAPSVQQVSKALIPPPLLPRTLMSAAAPLKHPPPLALCFRTLM